MERERLLDGKYGALGWLGLAAYVAAFDLLAPESLTHAFHRGRENPNTRAAVVGAWAVTTAHLMGAIPRQVDPFYLLIDRVPHAVREMAVDVGVVNESVLEA